MTWVADVLNGLGITGRDHPTSFPDGAAFRLEIPSVEGPRVLEAVLRAGVMWKVSAAMSPSNPVTVKILEDLGASTVNIPADATLAELAEMRAAVSLPLDLYVESPDPLGGVVRGQELGDLIGAGAPLYAKFGLSNAAGVYPSGHHLEAVASANAVEKAHRAAVAPEWLERLSPRLTPAKPGGPRPRVPGPP